MHSNPDILIVDDREENLVAIELLLQDCDAQLHRALSGNEALALMLKQDFAMILLDIQMPGMDGFEVAELMRLNEKTRHLPIIFVTAISAEQKHVFKGYEVGAVDFLFKPIEPKILLSKVNIFLNLWNQKRRLAEALAENEQISKKLKRQAEYDSLTGLPNRTLFYDRLKQAILSSDRSDKVCALMFIDLDHFKWVNDSLGHDAGDKLLVEVAKRLQECVRKSDTVARLGGDEFTVIIKDLACYTSVEQVANKILKALATPFYLHHKVVHISGSIGITFCPSDSTKLEELLKNADTAMYQAKSSGRNTFRYFTRQMNIYIDKRMNLESLLRTAIERDEFRLHYQPKVDLTTGLIIGAEALVRWERPDVGLVYPDEFIPFAEEVGLISSITKWVLETACKQNQSWHAAGFENLRMSVNISSSELDDKKGLVRNVGEILSTTGMLPQNLELEITEHTVMGKLDIALETLKELKKMGIHISLDDFGTGYSSLAVLKKFPIKTLKIDKSFIRDLSTDLDDSAIVSAIIAMASKLSLSVTAEGVETEDQLNFLKNHGCHEMQGYYFSRPVPAERYVEMLKSGKSLPTTCCTAVFSTGY